VAHFISYQKSQGDDRQYRNSTIQFSSCNHEKLWNTAKEEETKLVATDHTGSLTSEYMKIIRCIILVDSISDRVIW